MQGGDLLAFLKKNCNIKEKEIRDAMILIMDALRYCHQMGIIHRDLKLENILIKNSKYGL